VWHVVVAAAALVIASVSGDPQQVASTHGTKKLLKSRKL